MLAFEAGDVGSRPTGVTTLSCSVIGNTSDFDSEEFWFEPRRDNRKNIFWGRLTGRLPDFESGCG